jgi:hypothetical protein
VNGDWRDAISLRLVSLALGGSGRLSDDLVLALAVRGALLVDLVLRYPTAVRGDAFGRDVRPTGFPPADRLLSKPGQEFVTLLRRGRVDQTDLATEHVRQGSWTRSGSWLRRRYCDQMAERTQRDALAMASSPVRRWEPADAALAALAGELGVLNTGRATPTDELLQATRTARPLVELVVQHISDNIKAVLKGPSA